MRLSLTELEGYLQFGVGQGGLALTYDRVVGQLQITAKAMEAAMHTDHECTADTWSAPPRRLSLDIDNVPTAVKITRVVCRAIDCTRNAVLCRLVTQRLRLHWGTQS